MFPFATLAALFLVAANAENVVTLTDATFQAKIDSTEFVLAEFYAPWCGHCKSLAPEYEIAATKLLDTPNVVLAKIDATEEKKLAEQFGISGFPTLKWFVNGKPLEYTGGRTADTIVSWIKKKTGPAVTVLKTAEEVEKFKEGAEVCAILLSNEAQPEFEAAAKAMEIPFAMAPLELKASLGLSSDTPMVVVYKQFDDKRVESKVGTAEEIQFFVESNSLPLVTEFSQKTAQKIFGGNVKQHFLIFVDKEKSEEKNRVVEVAQEVAKAHKGKYLFVSVDKSDARVTDFFGIKTFPNARIVQMAEKGMKKYQLLSGSDLTVAGIQATLEAHAAGTLPLDLKSEEIPASNDEDVKVIVGKSFEQIVRGQPGKDVFVEFYAPWCGHCKSLAPKYEELGKWAKAKPNLVVAKMDASMNEVAGVEVTSFPTLKLFKDGGEVVDYSGERELNAMIAFLEKHASSCAAP